MSDTKEEESVQDPLIQKEEGEPQKVPDPLLEDEKEVTDPLVTEQTHEGSSGPFENPSSDTDPPSEEEEPSSPPDPLFQIVKTELGFGWISTKPLKAGTIILEEIPIYHAPQWTHDLDFNSPPICLACGLHLSPITVKNLIFPQSSHLCSVCLWPVCSVKCQKMPIHADNECKIFARNKIRFPPSPKYFSTPTELRNFLLMLRGVGIKKKDKQLFKNILKLQSSWALPAANAKFNANYDEQFGKFTRKIQLPDVTRMEGVYKQILRISLINSYSVDSKEYLVDIQNSFMVGQRPDFKIRVQAAVDIPQGEPLTVSYEPLANISGTFETQYILQNFMGFVCLCRRCVDCTELGTFMSGVACKDCRKVPETPYELYPGLDDITQFGYFLPQNPLNADWTALTYDQWKCFLCGRLKMASTFLPAIDDMKIMIDKLSTPCPVSEKKFKNLEKLCETILRYDGGYRGVVLHKNHWLLQLAARKILELKSTKICKLNTAELENFSKLSRYLLAIEDVIMPGLSRNRAKTQLELSRALHHLAKKREFEGSEDPVQQRMEALEYLKECKELEENSFNFYKTFNPSPSGFICWEAMDVAMASLVTDVTMQRLTNSPKKVDVSTGEEGASDGDKASELMPQEANVFPTVIDLSLENIDWDSIHPGWMKWTSFLDELDEVTGEEKEINELLLINRRYSN